MLRLVGLKILTKGHPGTELIRNDYKKNLDEKNNIERPAEAERDGWMEFKLLKDHEGTDTTNQKKIRIVNPILNIKMIYSDSVDI